MEEKFMNLAISEAEKAAESDEVPVGAVIVKDGKIIAKAHNRTEKKQNALYHAETIVINKACKKLKSWRLDGTEIYVTLEPCPMCAGAIVNARVNKVYFGAYEKKSGSAESKFRILTDSGLNHTTEFEGGIEEERCSAILKDYFKKKRTLKP
mgnify:CR=1 FL=1